MPRRLPAELLLCLVAVALAGCGNSRTPVPSLLRPVPAGNFRPLDLSARGVLLEVPHSWAVKTSAPPLLATGISGSATFALWDYRRSAPAPRGGAALRRARLRLVAAVKRRDPGLQLIRAKALRVDHRLALELDAVEQINGLPRRVRSVHIWYGHTELVLDAYAPPDIFHSVDHDVFSRVKRSLRLVNAGTA